MHELLLDICKRKIDNGISFEEILDSIKRNKAEDTFAKIEERLKQYIQRQKSIA